MPPVPAGEAWLEGRLKQQITCPFLMAWSAWLWWDSSQSTYRQTNVTFQKNIEINNTWL